MRPTPRTEFLAGQCSTDSEHTDHSAYLIMYDHARTLERELGKAVEIITYLMSETTTLLTADGKMSVEFAKQFDAIQKSSAFLAKIKEKT